MQAYEDRALRRKRAPVIQMVKKSSPPNSLRFYRALSKMSQTDVAHAVGCKPQNLHRAETKGTGLGRRYWLRLAELFGVPALDLEVPRDVVLPCLCFAST